MGDAMWFSVLELIGIVSFSISGAMVAIEKKVDVFGVVLLGVITAFGGGFLRDLTLGQIPPTMFYHVWLCLIAAVAAVIVFLFAYYLFEAYRREEARIERGNNFIDAIGLGTFSVIGTQVTLAAGFSDNAFLCICMGVFTGICGGVIRDLLVREIPFVLRKRIYALASIAGAFVFYYVNLLMGKEMAASLLGIVSTFLLRALATRFKWDLPKVGDFKQTKEK